MSLPNLDSGFLAVARYLSSYLYHQKIAEHIYSLGTHEAFIDVLKTCYSKAVFCWSCEYSFQFWWLQLLHLRTNCWQNRRGFQTVWPPPEWAQSAVTFPWMVISTSSTGTAQGGGRSFKDRKPIGEVWLLWCMDGRENPLMDRMWLELYVYFLERLQWSPHPQLLDVVWCSVVQCRVGGV